MEQIFKSQCEYLFSNVTDLKFMKFIYEFLKFTFDVTSFIFNQIFSFQQKDKIDSNFEFSECWLGAHRFLAAVFAYESEIDGTHKP